MRTVSVLSTLLALLLLAASPPALGVEVTNSGDNLRTGWYPDEPSITPQLVSGGTFGQLWSAPVEGQVYAQPLLDDGTLFVATEANKVYGLDPTSGALKWSQPLNLGTPWNPSDIGCGDLTPSIGVTATPVIDPATNIAYLTHKTYASGTSGPARWYMDAVDVATGVEEPGFPVQLSGTAQNSLSQTFQPTTELQRPGLLLMNGVVYAAFGSHCDITPWQGWVFGVSTAGAIRARWVADASGNGAGIWQSGAGLTSDAPGNILLSTGNGGAPETPTPGDTPPANLGESIVRLQVQPDGSLKPTDFFAPFDAESLDSWDADFASGGVTGLPEAYFGTLETPRLAVAVGKDGYVYLLNRDDLGGIAQGSSGADDVVQRIGPYGGVWSRPGIWPGEGGWVYIPTASGGTTGAPSSGNLRVYQYGLSGTGMPALSLQATSSDAFGFSSSAPVITSDATTPGSALVWLVWAPNGNGTGAQLRAYDPIPVAGKPVLRFSAPVGTSSKFAIPGVGAGRLYVGTRDGRVLAFGSPVTPVLSGAATAFPTTTLGESSEKTLTLTATEALTLSSLESSSPEFTVGAPSIPLPATLSTGQTIQVPVTFSPTSTGLLAATLTAKTSTGKMASFALSGTGQAASAKLEVTPPLVTFGGTTVGGHLSAGATFRNVGGTPLTIEAVHLPEAPFGAEGAPAVGSTIAPGGSLTITVTFDPTATGKFSDQIGLDTSGGNGAIGLSGSAGLPGALRISSETNDYGEVLVGASASKSFTITNTGGTNVTITKSKPPIGGAFTATTSLPEGTTIEPGEIVTETVTFAPTSPGAAGGVWEINGEDTTGLHEVRFDGVGAVPTPPTVPTEETSPVMQTPLLVQQGPAIPPLSSPKHWAPPLPDAELTNAALVASSSGTVNVDVSCPIGETRCFGRVALRTLIATGATSGHSRTGQAAILTLAAGSFTVAGGRVTIVRLHLSHRARALLARRHLIRARVTLVSHDPKGVTHTTVRTTITIRTVRATRGRN
jgi:iron transport multicopper oxidase